MPLTAQSTYGEVISYDNCRFKDMSKDEVEKVRKAFLKFDTDGDGSIGALEMARVFETLGETRTTTQVRQLLSEVDEDGDGKIQFAEMLALFTGQTLKRASSAHGSTASLGSSANLNGRVKDGLVNRNAFFEAAVAAQDDKVDERVAQIKAEYAVRKVERATKKEAEDRDRQQREADEVQKREARARLAARAALFESAQ